MLPQSSHIARKNGVYFFRRRIPGRPRAEIALSLRTKCFREAQWLATSLGSIFDQIVPQMADMPDVAVIVRKYLRAKLDFDLWVRTDSKGRGVYPPHEDGDSGQADDLKFVQGELETAQIELTNRLYDHQGPLIDELMAKHNLPPELRSALAHGVLQANVEAWETIKDRTLGKFPSMLLKDDEPKSPANGGGTRVAEAVPADDSPLLSTVLPEFLSVMSEDVGWSGQTRAQNEATYRLFVQACGDKPVKAYSRRDVGEFYQLLRKLPAMYSKLPEYRGKTTREIVELAEGQVVDRLSMRTTRRHFAALSRFFGYLKRQGLFSTENPALGFEFPLTGRANQRRQMWDGERLRKLFASPVWSGCKSEDRRSDPGSLVIQDEKYWLPILGLFHGNRLEEFAQLRREDVRQEQGIWFFDIHDEGERQIKNEQSRRRVPVHPAVLKLNFIEYVQAVGEERGSLVFPNLAQGGPDAKLGYYFTKWWTRYRRAVGLYEKGLDYHSFRHGVTTKLYAADVSEPLVDELTGHEGKSTSRVVYKKELPLSVLFVAISKVSWPEVEGLFSKFAGEPGALIGAHQLT